MRRLLTIVLMTAVFIFSGCARKNDSEKASRIAYEGYYRAVSENERFADGSLYYDLSCEMSSLPDGTYRYYVFLDDVQTAMYDVVFLAVENDVSYDDVAKMMPCVGVFEETEYSLIPYQSNPDAGFVKGLVIGGESDRREVSLKILVEWKDRGRERTYREFIHYIVTPDGYRYPEVQEPVIRTEEETEEAGTEETDE